MIRQCESGIPVNDLEPLNNVTKKHTKDAAWVLHPPL